MSRTSTLAHAALAAGALSLLLSTAVSAHGGFGLRPSAASFRPAMARVHSPASSFRPRIALRSSVAGFRSPTASFKRPAAMRGPVVRGPGYPQPSPIIGSGPVPPVITNPWGVPIGGPIIGRGPGIPQQGGLIIGQHGPTSGNGAGSGTGNGTGNNNNGCRQGTNGEESKGGC